MAMRLYNCGGRAIALPPRFRPTSRFRVGSGVTVFGDCVNGLLRLTFGGLAMTV